MKKSKAVVCTREQTELYRYLRELKGSLSTVGSDREGAKVFQRLIKLEIDRTELELRSVKAKDGAPGS
jgi:hypothetical protein